MSRTAEGIYPDHARAIDALLIALATQAGELNGTRFSEGALECLAEPGRSTVRRLLGSIGHLVHYGAGAQDDTEAWLSELFEQLLAVLRRARHRETGGLLPGDVVEMITSRPQDHLEAGDTMRVYWVDNDGTVDVGHESLADDYLIFTVPLDEIRQVANRGA